MTITKKDIEKRMLVNKTVKEIEKQLKKLEEQKKIYIEAGKQAKQKGLTAQYNLALSGLKMTIAQQRRVYEMKLNFELTSQMRDMSQMTTEFLQCMGALSKDMLKLTKEKDFAKVQKQFTEAMLNVEVQTERMEAFMDETESAFSSSAMSNEEDNTELEKLMTNEAIADDSTEDMIAKELEELKKKMG